MQTIDVGKEFFFRLANRDKHQGDGLFTAQDFREKYLAPLDNEVAWPDGDFQICLDFANVLKIGPSFANEAFAYFTKYAKPEEIKKRIIFSNISAIKMSIIDEEISEGYKR